MTDKALAVSAAPGGALSVGGAVEFNLDGFPTDRFNRLIPTQTIMTSDLLAPVVQVVTLDLEADTYKSNDVPAGHRAPGARALNKFASAAGVSFIDERRVDDGKDPDLIRVTVTATMQLPTGQRITSTGTKEVNLTAQNMTVPQRAKYRSFFYEHVATRARNRAIRALLSLRSSYPEADIRKPFAVVSFVPNTAHPDVRKAMIAAMAPAVASLYGPERAKAIGPGTESFVEEAPEDDTTEGTYIEAAPLDEPEWFKGTTPATAPVAEQGHRLERMLRAAAAEHEADPANKEPRSDEQAENLKKLLAPVGFDAVVRVLGRVFGLKNIGDITRAQASALFIVSDAEDHFADLWRELDAIAQAQR